MRPEPSRNRSRTKWLRRLGLTLGILLLAAALAMVYRQREMVFTAFGSIREQPVWTTAAYMGVLVGSILANIVLTAGVFSLLISRYGRVGVREMQHLIATTTLLNYIPLRPGLFTRVAYHRMVNQIPITASTKTLAQSAILTVVVCGYAVVSIVISGSADFESWPFLLAPLPVLIVLGLSWHTLSIWAFACTIRTLEFLVIAARYYVAFALLGSPIDGGDSFIFASVAMVTGMIPFLSNGLGLREWTIGLLAPLVTAYQLEVGITADLLIRAVEFITVAIVGSISISLLAGRFTRFNDQSPVVCDTKVSHGK